MEKMLDKVAGRIAEKLSERVCGELEQAVVEYFSDYLAEQIAIYILAHNETRSLKVAVDGLRS
jgi:hypothetical protein